MKNKISYMSGAGNKFLVFVRPEFLYNQSLLDDYVKILIADYQSDFIIEGVMSIEKSDNADFLVTYYNPDGSTGMMCGNGGRCAVFFARFKGLITENQTKVIFSMANKSYTAEFTEKGIAIYFESPSKELLFQKLNIDNAPIDYDYFDVGTQHTCINLISDLENDIVNLDIIKMALPIRQHQAFLPTGVNVNLYSVVDSNKILLRTFEKGVEAETGACGTGAISTALSAFKRKLINFPVEIVPTSKESLWVSKVENYIVLEGPAEIISEFDY